VDKFQFRLKTDTVKYFRLYKQPHFSNSFLRESRLDPINVYGREKRFKTNLGECDKIAIFKYTTFAENIN
jgi:hypothetical protein